MKLFHNGVEISFEDAITKVLIAKLMAQLLETLAEKDVLSEYDIERIFDWQVVSESE